jgi:DNA-binding transcriptional MerR regulator
MRDFLSKGRTPKYLIHDASKLAGIAAQTIRYYEEMGIINGERDENTGYRFFNTADIHTLMICRMYRAYGFNLRETKTILDEKGIETAAEMLRGREKGLEQEIIRQQYILDHLRRLIGRIDGLEEKENVLSFTERPALLGLLYRRDQQITADIHVRNCVSGWMEYMPMPQPLIYYEADCEKTWIERYNMGLCMTREDAEFLRLKPNRVVFSIEPCPCVYTVVKLKVRPTTIHSQMPGLMEKMARRGLECAGPICGRMILPLDRQSPASHAYFEFWIPYRERSQAAGRQE